MEVGSAREESFSAEKNAYEKIFWTQFLKLIMIIRCKYLQGIGFHLIITVFHFFISRHRFLTSEKNVHLLCFRQKILSLQCFSTFSPQIVEYQKSIITAF